MSKPNKSNFCGGNYDDWLEVYLTGTCNGKCEWCINKDGYNPEKHVPYTQLAAVTEKYKNILLLGGEPTFYPTLKELIGLLRKQDHNVYLTTNGHNLQTNGLELLTGINISIHHYDLMQNWQVTGIYIKNLKDNIAQLKQNGVKIRFNCNLIKGKIDSKGEIERYITWTKSMGADEVRFAELKDNTSKFINLSDIYGTEFGINDEPCTKGCCHKGEILEMPVQLRQMCGFQTPNRAKPLNIFQQKSKKVLYYDGILYPGWQKQAHYSDKETILKLVASGELDVKTAMDRINQLDRRAEEMTRDSIGCQY